MMDSREIRKRFLDFFEDREHRIVPSAPMVIKDDPTLMFTNAGMNQFKDYFLGNKTPQYRRIANTQKCLRVSGKHNDLEEVGLDTYHHTMFEMLGNWSFGDYFKKEAIEWAWELLTGVYHIDPDRLYITVFGGDPVDGTSGDDEALMFWKGIVHEDRILFGSKKDNFWEMGDTGPCGPCSEIHVDLREQTERDETPGHELVNKDHPEVIEIWNLVFIEFNRAAGGSLMPLPSKHVDTGMGFERLTMVLQEKKSNYDTDIFKPLIQRIEELTGAKYGSDRNTDIAIRVIADHLRAVVFAVADGQLPSNVKAGYVIRRILRRAIRYGYTWLNQTEPFINNLIPVLVYQMGDFFPELKAQQELIVKVITEEETAFLRTLANGIKRFDQYVAVNREPGIIDGNFAFELFDTYGFPVDLTRLMAREKSWDVNMEGFNIRLEEQKERSKSAAGKTMEDWIVIREESDARFVGYETLQTESGILKYRKVIQKKKEYFQVVLDKTPFYAESGGQVGDTGHLEQEGNKIKVHTTVRENDLISHIVSRIPDNPEAMVTATVDAEKRKLTANNHTATHLMHAALRKVLGNHVEQKGSLVDHLHLRFDFSHYSRLTDEEIRAVETMVNEKIRENIALNESKDVPMDDALKMGAMALFGEKYGETVRVITFNKDYSVELCGGTHVSSTGQIGFFKIISESNIAAGVRRIEAITAVEAEKFIQAQNDIIRQLRDLFKTDENIIKGVNDLIGQNNKLHKQVADLYNEKAMHIKKELLAAIEPVNGVNFIAQEVDLEADVLKNLAYLVRDEVENLFLVLASVNQGKVSIVFLASDDLVRENGWHIGLYLRDIAKLIDGGGGGQPHFATAGGKNPGGIIDIFNAARQLITRSKRAE
ncbi:MAG: alanine--tRNA ligase [Bacteroidales bacterium]|nr:alanine--tRNA ligase [Bacteroidales bacterium]